jgi:hypothetical protein
MEFLKQFWIPTVITSVFIGMGIPLVKHVAKRFRFNRDSRRVYNWVKNNTTRREYRTIKTIAGKNNLTIEYAEKLLSSNKKLRRGLGTDRDIWTLNETNNN